MQKINYPNLFENFIGREYDLRQVTRYHIYSPMYYRSNLFTHSKRVLWLLQSTLPFVEEIFGNKFDFTKAQLMAVVHDDLEIVMGDIQAGHKVKMTSGQLVEVSKQEHDAVEKIAKRFPYNILGYNYGDLIREEQTHTTLESKLVKYVDRFDGLGEALHEIYAGNRAFATNSIHNELGIIDLPSVFYQKWLSLFPQNNPEFGELFLKSHPIFTIPVDFNMEETVSRAIVHTKDSILEKSFYEPYNVWKKIIIENGDEEEIENLHLQKEFIVGNEIK